MHYRTGPPLISQVGLSRVASKCFLSKNGKAVFYSLYVFILSPGQVSQVPQIPASLPEPVE